jgi:hypothetical protein
VLAVTLCGLASAALAPFAWSHHYVWVVPLGVLLGTRVLRGDRWAAAGLVGVLAATVAVVTALPGPHVGPIPSTGLISVWPDAYLLLFLAALATSESMRGLLSRTHRLLTHPYPVRATHRRAASATTGVADRNEVRGGSREMRC